MAPRGLSKSWFKGPFLGLFICSLFLVCSLEGGEIMALGREDARGK